MTNSKKYQRLEHLQNALEYCSELQQQGQPPAFSTGERICINQERGALFTQLANDSRELLLDEVRFYQCDPALQSKIEALIKIIKATNWDSVN